jgi:ribosomal protein S18 acetylase RimI-like enzyme
MRIRTAQPDDISSIERIAVATRMFPPEEVGFIGDLLRAQAAGEQPDAQWWVAQGPDGVMGAAYVAPEPFADRIWNLYFISVDPTHQSVGVGQALMAHVEATLRATGSDVARVLIVETSSTDQYARTRDFYRRLGYDQEARIREFYGPGDHKIVFWKQLNA